MVFFQVGMRQEYELGHFLRGWYLDFVSDSYKRSEVRDRAAQQYTNIVKQWPATVLFMIMNIIIKEYLHLYHFSKCC